MLTFAADKVYWLVSCWEDKLQSHDPEEELEGVHLSDNHYQLNYLALASNRPSGKAKVEGLRWQMFKESASVPLRVGRKPLASCLLTMSATTSTNTPFT